MIFVTTRGSFLCFSFFFSLFLFFLNNLTAQRCTKFKNRAFLFKLLSTPLHSLFLLLRNSLISWCILNKGWTQLLGSISSFLIFLSKPGKTHFSSSRCLSAYLNRGGAGRLIYSTEACPALFDCFKHWSKGKQHLEILELGTPQIEKKAITNW